MGNRLLSAGLAGLAMLVSTSAFAANIAFVTFHPDDNTPSTNAATAGFTQAPDVGYTQLLRANGHMVTRIITSDTPSPTLNSYDLVIVSRSVSSGHYELDAETAAWNGITAPMMLLNGYVLRSNRLGFTTGTTIPDVSSSTVKLAINNPAHPIFAGIALDAGNLMVNDYAQLVTFGTNTERGISVNTNPLADAGVVLAKVGTAGDAAFDGMIIGEWSAGAAMANSPPDTLGGHRLVFLTGSREHSGLTSEGAGIFDLTADGSQMFLNAVNYMAVPEPSSLTLLGLGALGLLRRRK